MDGHESKKGRVMCILNCIHLYQDFAVVRRENINIRIIDIVG